MRDSAQLTHAFFDKPFPGEGARPRRPVDTLVFSRTAALLPQGRADQVAVDLGCHWGRYTRLLGESYGEVWGLDQARSAIGSAPGAPPVRYAVMDLEDPAQSFPFSRKVDFFLAIGLFEMLRDPAALGRRLAAVAAEGARLLLVVPNRRHPHFRAFRAQLWVARRLLGRRSAVVFNNGLSLADLIGALEPSGFRRLAEGTIVGIPPAVLMILPDRLQAAAVSCDPWLYRNLGGAYAWALLEHRTADAGPAHG